jgi:hypothetical protein
MSPTASTKPRSTEDRLQAIEDRLEIGNLLASHPPTVDSLTDIFASGTFTADGIFEHGMVGSLKVHELGSDAKAGMTAAMREAAKMGLAHFSTPPYIKLGKNTAVAFSYVSVTVRDPTAESITVPAHGSGQGHRLYMTAANRWDLVRTDGSWKVSRRKLVTCDGSDAPRELQRSVLEAVLVD